MLFVNILCFVSEVVNKLTLAVFYFDEISAPAVVTVEVDFQL
jgi:hypothetical protein